MLIFVVFGVLSLGALLILVTHAHKPNTARSWFFAISTVLIAWIAAWILRLYLPSDFPLLTWFPDSDFADLLALAIDTINWPYLVTALSMALAVLLTDTTRADATVTPLSWVRLLAVTGLNLIAILAANPLTMAVSWMMVDLVDIMSLMKITKATDLSAKITSAFGIRLLSSFLLVFATAVAWRVDPVQINYAQMTNASIYFLMAAGLRLGVLPLNLPFLDAPELRRGSGILFRLLPAASALVLIAQLQEEFLIFNEKVTLAVRILTLIAALYSAVMWMTRQNSFEGRPYWVVGFSAFALQSALNGHPGASRVWGLAMLLAGSLLFLFNPPIRRIRFLPMLGLLAFIGLPYTLAASGWEGLLPDQFNLVWVVMILTHAFLVIGYIRYIFEADSTVTGLEKYARVTFPLGLVILIQTIMVLGIIGWQNVLTTGNLIISGISLGLVVLAVLFGWKFGFQIKPARISAAQPFSRLAALIIKFFRDLFSLSWVSVLAHKVFSRLLLVGDFLNQVIEGDGGILWSLVFIVVLSIFFLTLRGGK